jgi:hypothetical protein
MQSRIIQKEWAVPLKATLHNSKERQLLSKHGVCKEMVNKVDGQPRAFIYVSHMAWLLFYQLELRKVARCHHIVYCIACGQSKLKTMAIYHTIVN